MIQYYISASILCSFGLCASTATHDEQTIDALPLTIIQNALNSKNRDVKASALYAVHLLNNSIFKVPSLPPHSQSLYPDIEILTLKASKNNNSHHALHSQFFCVRMFAISNLVDARDKDAYGYLEALERNCDKKYLPLFPKLYSKTTSPLRDTKLSSFMQSDCSSCRTEAIAAIGDNKIHSLSCYVLSSLSSASKKEKAAAIESAAKLKLIAPSQFDQTEHRSEWYNTKHLNAHPYLCVDFFKMSNAGLIPILEKTIPSLNEKCLITLLSTVITFPNQKEFYFLFNKTHIKTVANLYNFLVNNHKLNYHGKDWIISRSKVRNRFDIQCEATRDTTLFIALVQKIAYHDIDESFSILRDASPSMKPLIAYSIISQRNSP